jgi:two-component system, LytTR family, sensor kinase
MKLNLRTRVLVHFLFWLVYIGLIFIVDAASYSLSEWFYLSFLTLLFVYIPSTYATYYFGLRTAEKNKNPILIITAILTIFIWYLVFTIAYIKCLNYFHLTTIYADFKIDKSFLLSSLQQYLLYFFLYALVYWYAEKSVISERKRHATETEKLQVEYNYLKSQINPHFLYNTLSFFYSRLLKQDKETANGLAALSDIMRYSLTAGNSDGKVALEQEMEQIENYIALQQMRFSGALHIRFTHHPPPAHFTIIPHALITLVENAFKHGVTDDAQHPLLIKLTTTENQLNFTIHNKKSYRQKDEASGGIGLQNLKDRLQLTYANKYSYTVKEDDLYYDTELKIKL